MSTSFRWNSAAAAAPRPSSRPRWRATPAGIFAAAVTHALWYQVGVFLLAFLLMLARPAQRGHSADAASV